MKRPVIYASLLVTGMIFGWWLRDMALQLPQSPAQVPAPSFDTQAYKPSPTATPSITPDASTGEIPTAALARETTERPEPARFEQLLREQAFEQAISYYDNALAIDDDYEGVLKPPLEAYLGRTQSQCASGAFVELVDLWLDTYYADIPVLLLLAENQRLCSSPEEAARTLQLARTYAIHPGARDRVSSAVSQLIAATDQSLTRQKDWVALLGFYEFLQAVDLATDASQLRLANLYQTLGEHQRSQDLLSALKASNDELDPKWTAALNEQWQKSAQPSAAHDAPAPGIPLIRRGDHFLVSATINDTDRVVLMIDTGASVTILSKSRFSQLRTTGLDFRNSRLFNTANGMTQGDVYQTQSITLGTTRLESPQIAVLDYASADDIDGLLGMNVLRNYRFEIDQDKAVLYLHPR